MSYFQGFVIPVPAGNKQAYLDMATGIAPFFTELGALATVECWEESVPDGKRTDLRRAVAAEPGEKIVFAWVWWPDRATCDAAAQKMMTDERMQPPKDPPFDMKRMIFAGFETAYDSGDGGTFGYVDAVVSAAPSDLQQAHADNAKKLDAFFLRAGALRTVDGWGVPTCPTARSPTSSARSRRMPGETSHLRLDRMARQGDPRQGVRQGMMQNPETDRRSPPAFDMQRAIFGGFIPDPRHRLADKQTPRRDMMANPDGTHRSGMN